MRDQVRGFHDVTCLKRRRRNKTTDVDSLVVTLSRLKDYAFIVEPCLRRSSSPPVSSHISVRTAFPSVSPVLESQENNTKRGTT